MTGLKNHAAQAFLWGSLSHRLISEIRLKQQLWWLISLVKELSEAKSGNKHSLFERGLVFQHRAQTRRCKRGFVWTEPSESNYVHRQRGLELRYVSNLWALVPLDPGITGDITLTCTTYLTCRSSTPPHASDQVPPQSTDQDSKLLESQPNPAGIRSWMNELATDFYLLLSLS